MQSNATSRTPHREAACLVALVLLAFGLTTGAGIFLDDATNLWHAQEAEWSLKSLGQAFSFNIEDIQDGPVPDALSRGPRYFRPLTVAMVKLETIAFGSRWWPYHLVNVFLQMVLTILLWRFLIPLTGARLASLGAVLFVLCPTNVMTVTWLSTRGDLLCGIFCLLSLLACQRLLASSQLRQILPAAGVLIFAFSAAMLAKESGAAIPFYACALTWWTATEAGCSWKVRLGRTLAVGIPLLMMLGGYFLLRRHILGPLELPDYYFYVFPISSWLFPYFVIQKLVYAAGCLFLFLPPAHIRLLMESTSYNLTFGIVLVPLLVVMFRLVRPYWRNDAAVRLFLPCMLLSMLPTLPLLLLPHYLHTTTFFFCPLLAVMLFGDAPQQLSFWKGLSGWKRWYVGVYVVVFTLAMLGLVSFFASQSQRSARSCECFRQAYDAWPGRSGLATGPAEMYLIDVHLPETHLFNEFRFRHPSRQRFKGFYVNLLTPLQPPSEVRYDGEKLRVRCTGSSFYAGLFFRAILGPAKNALLRETVSCPYYSEHAEGIEENPSNGDVGAREILVHFNPDVSRPENRLFFQGGAMGRIVQQLFP